MRALLDVNVLIALLDPNHMQHRMALTWFVENADSGWASCPLTQNGCLRVLSQPSYPNPVALREVELRLREFTANPVHEFWADDLSLLDGERFDLSHALGPRQLTDIYLLGLACAHNGRLVSFDQRISPASVPGAGKHHLLVI